MAHYIDADRLREELQKPKTELKVGNYYLDNSEQAVGYENALIDFELLIDSLQQEQPEVDIDEEIEKGWEELEKDYSPSALDKSYMIVSGLVGEKQFSRIARHFYELGLNARKEE